MTSNKLTEILSNLDLEKEFTEDDLSLINQLVDGEEMIEYSDQEPNFNLEEDEKSENLTKDQILEKVNFKSDFNILDAYLKQLYETF